VDTTVGCGKAQTQAGVGLGLAVAVCVYVSKMHVIIAWHYFTN